MIVLRQTPCMLSSWERKGFLDGYTTEEPMLVQVVAQHEEGLIPGYTVEWQGGTILGAAIVRWCPSQQGEK